MPPKLPISTKLMSMMPPDEYSEWKDRAIASSPWGGGMYGLAGSLRAPVLAPSQGDPQMEGEYRQSSPSDMAFYNEPDMRAQPVSGISDLAQMLTGGRERNSPPSGRLAQALIQDSNPQKFDEDQFQNGIRGTEWFSEFVKQYGEEPDLRQMSDDPRQGPNYDYRKAWSEGIRPVRDPHDNGRFHWSSAAPSGEMLKSANHPTAWKEYFMREYGVNPDELPADLATALRGSKY